MSIWRNVALDNDGDANNEVTSIEATLYWIHVHNSHASTLGYIHIYDDVAANVTPGTTTPTASFPVVAGADTPPIMVNEVSQRGWTICASDAAAGSGTAPATIILNAKYG